MNKTPDFDAAAGFLAAHARVLDRRTFQRLFGGGGARPVRDALAAYRNDDGGFGYALEPDVRTEASQPAGRLTDSRRSAPRPVSSTDPQPGPWCSRTST